MGKRFSACVVLKFVLQRREGEKREGVQISKQSTQNLGPNNSNPVHCQTTDLCILKLQGAVQVIIHVTF